MNKTLITKLNGRVANTELLRLGELRITIDKEDSPTAKSRSLDISVRESTPIEIIGEGYFTDENLSANKGKSMNLSIGKNTIYLSNDNIKLSILNKYTITSLFCERSDNTQASASSKHKHFDLDSLKYCTLLNFLSLSNTSTTGNLSEISGLTKLTSLYLSGTLVEGDLSSVSGLTLLEALQLENTPVTGNLSSLSGLTKLISLYLRGTKTNGNADLLKCYNATGFYLSNVVFNANAMRAFSKLRTLILYNSSVSGDLAILSDNLSLLTVNSTTTRTCTWSSRKSSAKIIAMPYYLLTDNIDKMLQDQAQCQADATSSTKTIVAKGTRTSASDAAVQTLQSKGYTVTILPAD